MSSSSLCTSDEEDDLVTPSKRKYKRFIFHGNKKTRRMVDFTDFTKPRVGHCECDDGDNGEIINYS